MFREPALFTTGNAPMIIVFALIMAVLVGAWLVGWYAGAREKKRRQLDVRLQQAPRTASQQEAERLIQLRFQRGEIDRPTYEREMAEVRRRHVA